MSDDRLHDDEWYTAGHPPTEPALQISELIWTSWTAPWSDPNDLTPLVWHWCNRSVFIAARDRGDESEQGRLPEWYEPQWVPAGVRGHNLISSRPLHVEPSVFCNDCCGLHGWIRGDKWVSA